MEIMGVLENGKEMAGNEMKWKPKTRYTSIFGKKNVDEKIQIKPEKKKQ